MYKRVIWIILDSVGIGALEDANTFGDEGADTLGHIYEKIDDYRLMNLEKMGIGNIDGINPSVKPVSEPVAVYCKAREQSNGKDTTIGHFEMCGIITKKAFPTYPDGFPEKIINEFIEKSGVRGILGNKVASGTEIIAELGDEHIATGKPIIYTSADSVFQIACHEEVYPVEELYRLCDIARSILSGEHEVARVIARPFIGESGKYERTSNRRDFSVKPSEKGLLSVLENKGINTYAVGKIEDIFAGVGIYKAVHTSDNMDGVDKTIEYMKECKTGLIFTNLVDYDSKWGHRRDLYGYAKGLKEFDTRLPEIINMMTEEDLLIINSDHGCDPTFRGTDHTREYIPVLIYNKKIKPYNAGIRDTFADIGATIADYFGVDISVGEKINIKYDK